MDCRASLQHERTELDKEAASQIAKSYVKNLTALHDNVSVKSSIQAEGETAAVHEEAKEYSLTDPKHLQNFLVDANIRLVRLEYLFKLADAGRVWPRRQEAESEVFEAADGTMRTALVTMEELQRPGLILQAKDGKTCDATIFSVSHTRESQQHPDPWRWQLQSLLQHCEPKRLAAELIGFQIWVFIDFMCLYQYKRSEEEQHVFQKAMRSMHLLYSHRYIRHVIRLEELTPESEKSLEGSIDMYCEATGKFEARPLSELVLNSTPYSQRGWCVAEVQWMSTKDNLHGCSPMSPAVFQERVARGEQGLADGLRLKFTHRSDAKLVSQLQEEVFLQHARQRKVLIAHSLPQHEVSMLATALPHFVNLEQLTIFSPAEDFNFGNSILELARGLDRLRPEKLACLEVGGDGIGDSGAAALAAAVAKCKELSWLYIASDDIGDAGAASLAAAVLECKKLTRFELRECHMIGDVGVAALAAASLAAPWVEFAMGQHVSQLAHRLNHKWGNRTQGFIIDFE
ncbi:NLRC3 [Symbiodinium sp. CCMP2592]|nr:NLRC3 [Symbiodinium sp. CCMP2592]